MNKFLVFFLILLLTVHAEKFKRIIGGSPTTTSTYPYQVAIVIDDGGAAIFCGGSILSKNFVLTAAHCFRDLDTNTDRSLQNVYAVSTTQISKISSSKKYSVIKANIHPAYSNSVSQVNRIDICVLEVSDISFDSNTLPIVLARTQDISLYPSGTPSFVSGFGLTDGNSQNSGRQPSDQLQVVQIPTVSLDTCNQALANSGLSVNYNIVCAGSDGKDSCSGDSGGPLAVVLNSNQYVQIGVVVFGTVNSQAVIQCGAAGNYGVYTDVAAYRSSFIEPITGSLPVLGDSGTATNNGTANSATSASVSFPLFFLSVIFFFFISFY